MEMWLGGGHVKQMRIALGCPVVPAGDAQLCLVRMNPIFVEGVNAGLFVRAIRKKKKKGEIITATECRGRDSTTPGGLFRSTQSGAARYYTATRRVL